jgi:hypothetical protein
MPLYELAAHFEYEGLLPSVTEYFFQPRTL